MRTDGVLNILGKLMLILSLFLLTPIPFSLFYHDGMSSVFVISGLTGCLLGGGLVALFPPAEELGYRDGFAVVSLSWIALALLGALPFYFSGAIPSFVDCYFESMSGFTTTGSTILARVEVLPKSVLFWRALTHWLGGMGIIVLTLAILPMLGIGGMQLYQAEMPGPTKDRLSPRIQDTARILWSVYVLFTVAEVLLLMLGGVGFFDALCHSFATLATGGFSTHSASIAFYNSVYVEVVVIFFMFLAGVNFSLHYRGIQGDFSGYWRNEEFRLYCCLALGAVVLLMLLNWWYGIFASFGENLRTAWFQTISIITTTGFGTADFDQWPPASKIILVAIMFIGGCAGSTGGGIKHVRVLLFFKYARLQLRKLVHPREVRSIKFGGVSVPREVLLSILGFFAIYIAFFILASIVVTALGVDIVTGTTAVVATLNNIGPGLNLVGPALHFGELPTLAKVVLIFCMLAGRLELYTLVVLLTPEYWKMARRPLFRWQKTSGKAPYA